MVTNNAESCECNGAGDVKQVGPEKADFQTDRDD